MASTETLALEPKGEHLDLEKEAVLDSTIQFSHPWSEHWQQPQAIFLTGATGLLGAHLLYGLLTSTNADIYCLIRAEDASTGSERLQTQLKTYNLWQEDFAGRIVAVVGDLSQPFLGMGKEQFQDLGQKIDVIYHNGAWVNYACPYETLRDSNVKGTEQALRLASLRKTKPVHFVSSISVFFSKAHAHSPILETEIPGYHPSLKGGYKQSKWVAEKLVVAAQERGLPACIYRPVRIMGNSNTGIMGNFNDLLCTAIKGCTQLGKYPAADVHINLVPVDYVANSIVHLSGKSESFGQAFHFSNPQQIAWGDLWQTIKVLGYPLEEVSYEEWLQALEKQSALEPDNESYARLLLLLSTPKGLLAKKPIFDASQTLSGLENSGISCPAIDKELVATYLGYFQKTGYLNAPPKPESKGGKKATGFWKSIRANVKRGQNALAIKPVARDGDLPLSFGQERLWLIEQLHSSTPVHNLRAVYRLEGQLDLDILRASIQEVIRRQEILRTSFWEENGKPVIKIADEVNIELPVVDLTNIPTKEQDATIRQFAKSEAQEIFDLTQAPLVRIKILHLGENNYVLVRTIHHIINDVWSDTIFLREVVALYEAFCAGKPSPLKELPIQYADFSHCQRQWLQGKVLQSQLDYWQKQLNDLQLLELPTDNSPQTVPSYEGAAHVITVNAEVTAALKKLSHQEGVSLFVTLMSAYKTLLYQYSGQEDITLCSPVAGRQQREVKKLLGYFSNIVLLRTKLSGNPSFRELLQRVSQASVGSQQHQDVPVQQLVDYASIPSAVLSRAMFTLQNAPSQPRSLGDVKVTLVSMEEGVANFDLSISVKETGEELTVIFRYKTDLFEESTITKLGKNFQDLLEIISTNPERYLADLPSFDTGKTSISSQQIVEENYVAPEGEIEYQIAGIWQQVLGIDKVGVNTNFFDVGGRSLAMIRIYHQLRSNFEGEIAVADLFKHPTIRGMAEYVSNK